VTTYADFLATKRLHNPASGFEPPDVNPMLFDWQADILRWLTRKGKAAAWLDCGAGKTGIQLDWGRIVHEHTGGDVLVLAPLVVTQQTRREADKFGVTCPVNVRRAQADVTPGITIANYEMLSHFDPSAFAGIILDESSCLKDYTSKTRDAVIDAFRATPYRLACTATPSPNDIMELGNHAEFLGVMTRVEMLSMFFVHDGGDTQSWRLKKHAERAFWEWVASWAVLMRRPSDLGYDDAGFILPPLNVSTNVVESGPQDAGDALFATAAVGLMEQRRARKASIEARVADVAARVNATTEQVIVVCGLNDESRAVTEAIPDAVEVTGSDSPESKEAALLGFMDGTHRVLVSKSSIIGWGLNLQNCSRLEFLGIDNSWESYYQMIRRVYRLGQTEPVNVTITISDMEATVVENINRKEIDSARLAEGMVQHTAAILTADIHGTVRDETGYRPTVPMVTPDGRTPGMLVLDQASGDGWNLYNADCVEAIKAVPSDSIGFSVFSPPFSSLYTYSNSDRDMGNTKDDGEFAEHFQYLVRELYRVVMPGRLVSFHCMNLPTSKARDGYIGIDDFRGDLIRAFQTEGFIYHSEVVIWKDPVTAMQRTKALGLLHKQIEKDSSMSRQGIPDYLVTMRKPGANPAPVSGRFDHYVGENPPPRTAVDPGGETFSKAAKRRSIDIWQQYASPVWMDINPSDTLQHRSAREHADERHIAPLQLQVIHRALQLWSNPGDLVLSPFAGIGSEGWEALKMGRRFVGIELKPSYYREAARNLTAAVAERDAATLFDLPAEAGAR
jgi:superfamily II DNA or RNA helicase